MSSTRDQIYKEFKLLNSCSLTQDSSFSNRMLNFPSGICPKNIQKNRYDNVLPNENTRVRLHCPPDGETDYINANYMNDTRSVILTQAPKYNTFHLFWIMVIENNVGVITMLTPVTHGKAEKYWPDKNETLRFTDTHIQNEICISCESIRNVSLENDETLTISKLKICTGDHRSLIVFHIHVNSWPDHSIPSSSNIARYTINCIKSYLGIDKTLLIHCSAGIGRAGTLAALWKLNDNICTCTQGHCNCVIKTVHCLRKYRAGVVQTKEQYNLIYELVYQMDLDTTTTKINTEIPINMLYSGRKNILSLSC